MKLREIAHCRAGDKGNTLNVSVIAFDERDFRFLQDHVTVERVRADMLAWSKAALSALNGRALR